MSEDPLIEAAEESGDEKEKILLDATIVGTLGSSALRAVLGNGHPVVAFRTRTTQAAPALPAVGAKVKLVFSPYDMSKGRLLPGKVSP